MKLVLSDTYRKTVTAKRPDPTNPDRDITMKFVAEFEAISRDEFNGLFKRPEADDDDPSATDFDLRCLNRVLRGVHGAEDADGNPIPPEAAADLVKRDLWLGKATAQAWLDSFNHGKAKRGN